MTKEEFENNEIIASLRKTRKSLLPEYFCGLLLLGILGYIYYFAIPIIPTISYFLLGLSLVAFASAEISRGSINYKITPHKVIITEGIAKKNRKNVHFHPLGFVPDINVKQNFLQRLLNYGTVFVHGSGEHHLEIRNINNPQQVLATIEKLIEKNRTPSTKRRSQ